MLGLIERLIAPVTVLLDKVIPDKDLREKLAHDIATMAERHSHDVIKAQIEVNKEEAKHRRPRRTRARAVEERVLP